MNIKMLDHKAICETTAGKLNIPVKTVDEVTVGYSQSIVESINKYKGDYDRVEVITPFGGYATEKCKETTINGKSYPSSYGLDIGATFEMYQGINEHLVIEEKADDNMEEVQKKDKKAS